MFLSRSKYFCVFLQVRTTIGSQSHEVVKMVLYLTDKQNVVEFAVNSDDQPLPELNTVNNKVSKSHRAPPYKLCCIHTRNCGVTRHTSGALIWTRICKRT